jgi:hypothetical protein
MKMGNEDSTQCSAKSLFLKIYDACPEPSTAPS